MLRTQNARARSARWAVPAAVMGTLAATFTAAPASAEETAARIPPPAPAHQLPPAPAAATVTPAAKTAPTTYTVRPGDTVSSIAARHGLRTVDVLSWNGLTWRSVIYPGQKLRLTAKASTSAPAAPASAKPSTAATVHTVVRGDTVYAIAKKYRTSVSQILAANRLGASAIIYPGQKLKVAATGASAPASSGTSSAPTTSAPSTSASTAKTHKVVAGDTLYGIAKKYGTSVAVLLSANDLSQGAIIYPGQTLRTTPPPNAQRFAKLDATQRSYAAMIISIGREIGASDRAIAIALATAMVESSMRNLDHGDRDSLGLFQQRPSQGWGTRSQILDARRSILVFYGGRTDPNGSKTRGLLDVSGWQNKGFSAAAQAVQISAYPHRYGQWEQQAHQWLRELG
ncbi:LysM peptidoglycan-binding domain-containing protein [Microbacterium istanbulense]|uniref:LysM peptidoglycan-binding domain-containing protein n=1 Tax=Microbacterium istanbulense TaxID=3122049 RepID=A0ABU8LJR7_9MICO